MYNHDQIEIQSQRAGETEWTTIGFDTNSPYTDARAPLVAGQPENRRYRALHQERQPGGRVERHHRSDGGGVTAARADQIRRSDCRMWFIYANVTMMVLWLFSAVLGVWSAIAIATGRTTAARQVSAGISIVGGIGAAGWILFLSGPTATIVPLMIMTLAIPVICLTVLLTRQMPRHLRVETQCLGCGHQLGAHSLSRCPKCGAALPDENGNRFHMT